MGNFLDRLLAKRCSHRFSWPRASAQGQYYQRCLVCGAAFAYDWNSMTRSGALGSELELRKPLITAKPHPVVLAHRTAQD